LIEAITDESLENVEDVMKKITIKDNKEVYMYFAYLVGN
jgi:hypothetical protein